MTLGGFPEPSNHLLGITREQLQFRGCRWAPVQHTFQLHHCKLVCAIWDARHSSKTAQGVGGRWGDREWGQTVWHKGKRGGWIGLRKGGYNMNTYISPPPQTPTCIRCITCIGKAVTVFKKQDSDQLCLLTLKRHGRCIVFSYTVK